MLPEPGVRTDRRAKRRYARFGVPGLLLCVILLYALAVAIDPWATHMGGSWTPLLYWSGSGNLVTSNGTYRLYVFFYPSPAQSELPYGGHPGTGAFAGWGYVCTSRGKLQALDLRGTIAGHPRTTDGSETHLYLNETQVLNLGQVRGGFGLHGKWDGSELVMREISESGGAFSSSLKIEHPSVTLTRESYTDFKAMCAHAPEVP